MPAATVRAKKKRAVTAPSSKAPAQVAAATLPTTAVCCEDVNSQSIVFISDPPTPIVVSSQLDEPPHMEGHTGTAVHGGCTSSPLSPSSSAIVEVGGVLRLADSASRLQACSMSECFFSSLLRAEDHVRCFDNQPLSTLAAAPSSGAAGTIVGGTQANGKSASRSNSTDAPQQADGKVLLDKHATSLYTSALRSTWAAEEEASSSPTVGLSDDNAVAAMPSAGVFNETTAAVVCGTASVSRLFREAVQRCYQHEDAVQRALGESEDRVVREGVRALGIPRLIIGGTRSSRRGAKIAAAAASAVNVFDCDMALPVQQQSSLSLAVSGGLDGATTSTSSSSPLPSDGETLVFRKHLRSLLDAHLAQRRESREAAQRVREMHRMQELPYLVDDIVRYTAIIQQLQQQRGCVGGGNVEEKGSSSAAALAANYNGAQFGDASQLLYQKYPAPLLRTSSFATETIRLLKWLRTWRKSVEVVAPAPSAAAPAAMPSKFLALGGSSRSRSGNHQDATKKKGADSPSSSGSGGAPPSGQQKFLKFFGAAAKQMETAEDSASKISKGNRKSAKDVSVAPAAAVGVVESDGDVILDEKKSHLGNEQQKKNARTSSSNSSSSLTLATRAESAFDQYCHAWQEAVQAPFLRTHVNVDDAQLSLSVPAKQSDLGSSSSFLSTGRRALPFFDELEEGTVYGVTSNSSCDAFGNRLRSARLAKKEADRRAWEDAQRRRREKKKGFFSRDDDDQSGVQQQSSVFDKDWGPRISRKRSREYYNASASDEEEEDSQLGGSSRNDDLTNIAVVCGPTGSGKTAAVYLAATLLHFRVVEMNASVRRCPKSVERLLAELTRSHRLSGLHHGKSLVSIEEELLKLKREHATLVAKMEAEQAAADQEAEEKRKAKAKSNVISAQAVAAFFKAKPKEKKGDGEEGRSEGKPATGADSVESVSAQARCAGQQQKAIVVDDDTAGRPSSSAAAASPRTEPPQTLLLIEEADVLLGDEAAKPFYAAIRDLAHESRVPLIVTVSDAAGGGGSEASPYLYHMQHPTVRALASREGRDVFSAMQEEDAIVCKGRDDVPSASVDASCVQITMNASVAAHHFGKRTPFTSIAPLSRTALYAQLLSVAAVETGLVTTRPSASIPSSGSVVGSPFTASSDMVVEDSCSSMGDSVFCGAKAAQQQQQEQTAPRPRKRGRADDADGNGNNNSKTLSLRVDTSRRKPFKVLDESSVSKGTGSNSVIVDNSKKSAADVEEMVVTDSRQFEALARWLRLQVFGKEELLAGKDNAACVAHLAEAHTLAAGTTDIRYWLNKMQLWLAQPRFLREGVSSLRNDDIDQSTTTTSEADQLVGRSLSLWGPDAGSLWDMQYGRYTHCLDNNAQSSPAAQRWAESNLCNYAEDIINELETVNHPTSRIDYTIATTTKKRGGGRKTTKQSASAADQVVVDSPTSARLSGQGRLSSFFAFTGSGGNSAASITTTAHSSQTALNSSDATSQPVLLHTPWRDLEASCVPPLPVGLLLPYGSAQRWLHALGKHRGTEQGCVSPLVAATTTSGLDVMETTTPTAAAAASTTVDRLTHFKQWWRRTKKSEAAKKLVSGYGGSSYEDLIGFQVLMNPPPPS